MRDPHISRAIHHTRNLSCAEKVAHIGSVGDAFNLCLVAQYRAVSGLQCRHEGMALIKFGRSELTAEPLDSRWMVMKPGIGFGGSIDPGNEFFFECTDGFARNQS